jgi:DNA/RNA-binding domain of Phe-tRNA-synthetase-like protein
MKFVIEKEIFDKLPDLFVGIVVAKGVDNSCVNPQISSLLAESVASSKHRFEHVNVKEVDEILPYREAFRVLGMNPNKYQCSVEAMFTRIAKGKELSNINPLVDLNNALSIKHVIPMGTHDLGCSSEDIVMRYSMKDDTFLPFGSEEEEIVLPGEVVYAVDNQVRTRRWTWRQSEHGKITSDTSYVFFPIDGFIGFNNSKVEQVICNLSDVLKREFHCQVKTGIVDKHSPEFDLTI